jgi:RNA polymerase sigma-70 factor (ECF subfamily)
MHRRTRLSDTEFRQRLESLLPRAAGYAWTVVRNRDDAEDAVQEAALKAYRNRNRYDRTRSFKGWWFAIVRNCCIDLVRRRRPGAAVSADVDSLPAWEPPEPHQYEDLHQAIARLSPPHREILELRYFGDCSYRDIAEALGIPQGTVMSRLHAARGALAVLVRKETA